MTCCCSRVIVWWTRPCSLESPFRSAKSQSAIPRRVTRGWAGGVVMTPMIATTTRTTTKSFKWIDPVAPEYNQVFSTGQSSGGAGWLGGTTIGSYYTVNGTTYRFENFGDNEPNNYSHTNSCGSGCNGEQALQIVAGSTGYWNDFPEQTQETLGYIIEYGDSTASGESLVGAGSKTSP